MRPITFTCTETRPLAPEETAGPFLDFANGTDFKGYGPLPGIKSAAFEARTPGVVGMYSPMVLVTSFRRPHGRSPSSPRPAP
jgi:hypothetical protein